MGLSTLLTDMTDMFTSLTLPTAYAEAPKKEADEDDSEEKDDGEEAGEGEDEEKKDAGDGEREEGGDEEEGEGEEGEGEAEEEEEEEDEPVDPKPVLEEECAHSAECAPYKHHFDDCVARVMEASEDEDHKGPKEDCVEEFFHLQHCATACAAPKLFRQLK